MKWLFHNAIVCVCLPAVLIAFTVSIADGAGGDVGALIQSLASPDPDVRYLAAKRLSHMGSGAGRAAPALVKALEDSDRRVKKEAMLALRSIGSTAVPGLIDTLNHRDPEVREEAALALGKMGTGAHRAIPALVKTLDDSNERVVDAAEYALRGIGKPAIPELKRKIAQGGDKTSTIKGLIKKIDPSAR